MCDHRTCAQLEWTSRYIEDWVYRAFAMAAAVKRGLLPIAHLNRIASPLMAVELVKHVAQEPQVIKAKRQWCKAEFLALSEEDPPAYVGSIEQRHGNLWMVAFHVLPKRRY